MIALLAMAAIPGAANASGWNDFNVKLDEQHRLFRANSQEIYIMRTDPGAIGGNALVFRHGPLRWVQWTSKCYLALHSVDYIEVADGDELTFAPFQKFVIHRKTGAVYGPLDQGEFSARAQLCGAPSVVPWMSVGDAYRYSFQAYPDQRFERIHVHSALVRGQVAAIVSVVLFIPVGVLLAGILFTVRRIQGRRWPVMRYAIGAWFIPPLLVSSYTVINGIFVFW